MQTEKNNIDIRKIIESLNARLITGNNLLETIVEGIYASDLMSDVLAYGKSGSVLLTGLNTIQSAISAYMAEFKAIVFLRGKNPGTDIQKFAAEKELVVLSTDLDMFEACLKLADINGSIKHSTSYSTLEQTIENITTHEFHIDGQDFTNAGMVSTQIKSILKNIGYDPTLLRRVAISTYEAEMNVVLHAICAHLILYASDKEIVIIVDDKGKGIKDIDQAMKEGFSTATEDQRALGFGAGMGLPNIKKNADIFDISSEVGKGTRLIIRFYVK